MIDIRNLRNHYANDMVFVTQHAAERCKQRGIKMRDIKEAVMNGIIIEE